ncbi:glycosyltransferase family 4 protein [Agriterribacter sp.]|uniref:glycosyltransferase family 4 protein n=1 Tax=Agriterribacter sp. TaxID=2821509 RepID=UPI002BA292C5|nr:glycosyltransferase family 4 protein [Agriterribacter sp.]HRP54751.1 glycosyltransferase family 4 protein [Agriterribacter sp.]
MRVLFLLLYHPEPGESSNLYADLVGEFVKNGHEVTVVSAAKESQPTALQKEENVDVLRVKTQKIFNVHPLLKGIATVRMPYQFRRAIKKYLSERIFDLIITPTPPITFVDIVAWLKRKYTLQSYLILRDIFPQNARDLGMMKNQLLINYFRKKEKKLYRYSDYIGCMSQGNIDYIMRHNPEVNARKLLLLPNWQKAEPLREKDETIRKQYGLEGKYVAIFGGNIGEPQKVENIVSLARAYLHKDQIVFLVMGNGTRRKHLEQMAADYNLTNLVIKDAVPRQDYQKLVCSADIGLISLSEKFTIPNIPSKTLSYFNARIPVLAAIDANTDYGALLDKAGAGLWSLTGDMKKYKQNFDRLYNDTALREQMGENGYNYLFKYLTVTIAYQTIITHTRANQ